MLRSAIAELTARGFSNEASFSSADEPEKKRFRVWRREPRIGQGVSDFGWPEGKEPALAATIAQQDTQLVTEPRPMAQAT
jgi:hypothetical protein